jgi:hypothetical protein
MSINDKLQTTKKESIQKQDSPIYIQQFILQSKKSIGEIILLTDEHYANGTNIRTLPTDMQPTKDWNGSETDYGPWFKGHGTIVEICGKNYQIAKIINHTTNGQYEINPDQVKEWTEKLAINSPDEKLDKSIYYLISPETINESRLRRAINVVRNYLSSKDTTKSLKQ